MDSESTQARANGSARRRRVVIGAAAAVVVVITVAIVVTRGGDDQKPSSTASGSSSGVDLPKPDRSVAQQTVEFLRGDGAPLVRFVDAASALTSATDVQSCGATGASLDAVANPDEVRALAAEAPDQTLGELFLAAASAVQDALESCRSSSSDGAAGAQLRVDLDLVARRRSELEAAAR